MKLNPLSNESHPAYTSPGESAIPAGNSFRARLAQYISGQALPVDKLGHQPRLYSLTVSIGRGHVYDDEVVYAAAWLHDLGVFIGHRPEDAQELARWDHIRYTLERGPAILERSGFPQAKVAHVLEVIRTHQPEAQPASLEGIILRDADILEQLGSIGILRVAAKIGRDTRYSTFTDAASTLRKNLAVLPGRLFLERAKTLAQPRVFVLQSFLEELDRESHGALY